MVMEGASARNARHAMDLAPHLDGDGMKEMTVASVIEPIVPARWRAALMQRWSARPQ